MRRSNRGRSPSPLGGLAPCDNRAARPPSLTLPHKSLRPGARKRGPVGRGCPFPSISLTRATSPRSHKPTVGRGRHGAAERPERSPRKPRALAPIPSGARFGFPQVSAVRAWGSANLRVLAVGIIWISLDSIVRNEPFQWVTRDPRPIFNSCGPFPRSWRRRPGRHSIGRSTALNPLAKRKPPDA